jgi:hypothetical protein
MVSGVGIGTQNCMGAHTFDSFGDKLEYFYALYVQCMHVLFFSIFIFCSFIFCVDSVSDPTVLRSL